MNKLRGKLSSGKDKIPDKDKLQTVTPKQLPEHFADDLFHYEMEIEQDPVEIEVVNRLLTLYAQAIEFYESQQNQRYLIFKNKTQKLLMRPNVVKAMNVAVEEQRAKTEPDEDYMSSKRLKQQLDLLSDDYEDVSQFSTQKQVFKPQLPPKQQLNMQKKEEINLSLQFISQQDNKDSITQILDSHKHEVERIENILKKNIDTQQDNVFQRQQRRKSLVEKPPVVLKTPRYIKHIWEDQVINEQNEEHDDVFDFSEVSNSVSTNGNGNHVNGNGDHVNGKQQLNNNNNNGQEKQSPSNSIQQPVNGGGVNKLGLDKVNFTNNGSVREPLQEIDLLSFDDQLGGGFTQEKQTLPEEEEAKVEEDIVSGSSISPEKSEQIPGEEIKMPKKVKKKKSKTIQKQTLEQQLPQNYYIPF